MTEMTDLKQRDPHQDIEPLRSGRPFRRRRRIDRNLTPTARTNGFRLMGSVLERQAYLLELIKHDPGDSPAPRPERPDVPERLCVNELAERVGRARD